MKRLLFTIFALFVLCMGLQAQNTNTTNNKGVTSQGQLDTVRNTRLNPTTQNEQIQSKFVDQFGKTGQRPGLSPYGQRLKAIIKVTSNSMVSNSVLATTASIAATVSDSGDYALPIIERGVCYATAANPTLLTATKVHDATISGKGFGDFEVSLSGLQPNTAYHARAYAVSMYDTVYGADLTFTTLFLAGSISYSTTVVEKMTIEPSFITPLTKVGDGTVTYSESGDNHNICTVNANTGEVTLTGNTGTCTITATVANSSSYTYATTTASYTLTVKTLEQTPLTFESKTAGAVVSFSNTMNTLPAIEYSLNGGEWTAYSSGITLTNIGDKVSFRGNNATYASSYSNYSSFSCTNDCYVYGNIMSLIDSTGYTGATELSETYTFYKLFKDNTHIVNHKSKSILLPATTLTESCYDFMFAGCTGLTSSPIETLPATTLPQSCYYGMFNGCTNMTTAPTISATTVGVMSCNKMFQDCSALESAPVLSAETIGNSCYAYMFDGCSSLESAPALPATTLANGCYRSMFEGCTSLTVAPALPATTLATDCYNSMFRGCSSLTTAPVLPAKTTAQYCYSYMFHSCSNLNSVTCFATPNSTNTNYWLYNVATTGTFYKASTASWSSGASGIPSGWTPINTEINLSYVTTDTIVPNGWTVTGTLGVNKKISIAAGATVTLNGVTINGTNSNSYQWAGLNCLGDATIILADGTTNTIKGFNQNYPGIHIPSGKTLIIKGTGTLNTSSNGYSAGIGVGSSASCGNIIISGGTITATGGEDAAGIGGGRYSSCGNITINGGTVTANGGSGGAGIGSGALASCGAITISGGTVTAMGGSNSAGIGCGVNNTTCDTITISGGTVTATGGARGAGIGSGRNNSACRAIIISGGTVEATGGDYAAAIGIGISNCSCGTITIQNTVTRVTVTKGVDATNSIGKSYDGTFGTVTIGGVTGPISASPYTYQPPKALSAATVEDVGKVIGQNGKIYDNAAAATSAGTTAVAMIIYVGSSTGHATYNHGLALALADEGTMDLGWSTAISTCSGKNTSTAVTAALWMLPSEDQWVTMGAKDEFSPYGSLRDGFTSVGGTNMQKNEYWSSTETGDYNLDLARGYNFDNGRMVSRNKGEELLVRACLVF